MFFPYSFFRPLLFLFRSLVDEIHELVELRRDDNLRTAVALLANLGVVADERVVLTTSAGGHTFRVDTEVILQVLNHT